MKNSPVRERSTGSVMRMVSSVPGLEGRKGPRWANTGCRRRSASAQSATAACQCTPLSRGPGGGSLSCLSWISRMPKLDQPHAAEALTGPSHHLLAFSVFRSRTNRHPGHFVIRQMANSNLSLSMWMAASVMRLLGRASWTEPPA